MAKNPDGMSYQCKPCVLRFRNRQELDVHRKRSYFSNLTHECPKCCLEFQDIGALNHHMVSHTVEYRCPKCPVINYGLALFTEHLSTAHKGRNGKLLCYLCGEKFRNLKTFHSHASSDLNKDYLCHVCGLKCFTAVFLKQHLNFHDAATILRCSGCRLTFSCIEDITLHYSERHK